MTPLVLSIMQDPTTVTLCYWALGLFVVLPLFVWLIIQLWFLPYSIYRKASHNYRGVFCVLTFIAGWFPIFWIILLLIAMNESNRRTH